MRLEEIAYEIGSFMTDHIGLPVLLTYETLKGTYTVREAWDIFRNYEEIVGFFKTKEE